MKSALTPKLVETGRVIVIDNYYNTLAVARWILSKGMHLLGTIRADRIHIRERGESWTLHSKTCRGTVRVISEVTEDLKPTGNYYFLNSQNKIYIYFLYYILFRNSSDFME